MSEGSGAADVYLESAGERLIVDEGFEWAQGVPPRLAELAERVLIRERWGRLEVLALLPPGVAADGERLEEALRELAAWSEGLRTWSGRRVEAAAVAVVEAGSPAGLEPGTFLAEGGRSVHLLVADPARGELQGPAGAARHPALRRFEPIGPDERRRMEEQPPPRRRGLGRWLAVPGSAANPWVTTTLLALIGAVGLLEGARSDPFSPSLLVDWGARLNAFIVLGELWRLMAYAWLHGSWIHLLLNGFALLQVGPLAEGAYGHARTLLIYLAGAVVAGLAGLVGLPASSLAVGASGAIMALLGATLAALWSSPGALRRQMLTPMVIWVLVILGYGLVVPNIDNWAHLGGLVAGVVLGLLMGRPGERPAAVTWGAMLLAALIAVAPLLPIVLPATRPPLLAAVRAAVPLSQRPGYYDLFDRYGEAALSAGDAVAAAEALEAATWSQPANGQARFLYAQALAASGREREALAQAEQAARLSPGDSRIQALIQQLRLRVRS
ncbi:MAG: rhomboid family intramembrane serine protease [Bacillota bacterium]|nr:rhomboid family intramembrane serine protease [Bacillota bacterium]